MKLFDTFITILDVTSLGGSFPMDNGYAMGEDCLKLIIVARALLACTRISRLRET